MMRDEPRRKVSRRAARGHLRAVDVAADRADQFPDTRHFLPNWRLVIGVEFDPNRIWIEAIQINLSLENVLSICGFHLRKITGGCSEPRRMKCVHSRINACPASSAGCALPARISCAGR